MSKSESIKELATALAKFQGEVANPLNSTTVEVKTKSGFTYSYKYAPLDEILRIVRPLLSKNGLSIVQAPYSNNGEVSITTTLFHSSGEWIEYPPLSLKTTDITPQAAGSVITYGRRYALSAILGIASDDDNDAQPTDGKPTKPASTTDNKQGSKQLDENQGKKDEVKVNLVTQAQLNLMHKIMNEKNYSEESMKSYILENFKKQSRKDLTTHEASELISLLQQMGQQQ